MGDKLEFMSTGAGSCVHAVGGPCGASLRIDSIFLIKWGSNQLRVRASVEKRKRKK